MPDDVHRTIEGSSSNCADRLTMAPPVAGIVAIRRLVKKNFVFAIDVSKATVVTTFLLSASNLRLRPILTKQLKPGSRIVTNTFSMGYWTPTKTDTFVDATGRTRTLYLYVTDGKVRQ